MDEDDRGSLEAEAGGGRTASDEELLSEGGAGALSDDDPPDIDVDMAGVEAEGSAGVAGLRPSLPPARRGGSVSTAALAGQEEFISNHMTYLHAAMNFDQGVNLKALGRCLASANNLYSHMIKEGQVETGDSIFLMYSSFFQPFMREVLPGVVHQLVNDERQVQLCGVHNVEEIRVTCCECIRLVAKYLHLHVNVLRGRELVPVISQRVGEDLSALLRTLGELLDSSILLWSPAFHGEPPSKAGGWDATGLGGWAQPPVLAAAQQAVSAQQALESGGGGGVAAGSGALATDGVGGGMGGGGDINLTEELPPGTPSGQAAVHAWQCAFVDRFGG